MCNLFYLHIIIGLLKKHIQARSAGKKMWVWRMNKNRSQFLVKLNKSATEIFRLLSELCGEAILSNTCMIKWYKLFSDNNERSGRLRTVLIIQNIQRFRKVIRGVCVMTVLALYGGCSAHSNWAFEPWWRFWRNWRQNI